MKPQDWFKHRASERYVEEQPREGRYSMALAYANSYHVGMSSLGFQRVWDLVQKREGWLCERFFCDGEGPPLSVEGSSPMGAFGCLSFSVSFEEDYVNLLAMLSRAGIPMRRDERGKDHPLVLVGGSCAMINPLPMAEFVDVFALGAAENVLPPLLLALEEESSKEAVLRRFGGGARLLCRRLSSPRRRSSDGEAQQAGAERRTNAPAGLSPHQCHHHSSH